MSRDRAANPETNVLDNLLGTLKGHGYTFYNQGEDMLAVLLPPEAKTGAAWVKMPHSWFRKHHGTPVEGKSLGSAKKQKSARR